MTCDDIQRRRADRTGGAEDGDVAGRSGIHHTLSVARMLLGNPGLCPVVCHYRPQARR
jgi:hypothetical protein